MGASAFGHLRQDEHLDADHRPVKMLRAFCDAPWHEWRFSFSLVSA